MKIGETALHTFTIPFELEDPQDIRIKYHQIDGVVVEKTLSDSVEYEAGDGITTIRTWLSSEETARFRNGEAAIVLEIDTDGGDVMISDHFFCPVEGFPREEER